MEFNASLLISLLVMMVIFWMTYGLLRICLFGPIMRVLEERAGEVATAREVYDRTVAETQAQLDSHRGRLGEARVEARKRRESVRREAQRRRQELLLEAKAEAETMLSEAQDEIDREVAAQRQALGTKARRLADRMTEHLIGSSV